MKRSGGFAARNRSHPTIFFILHPSAFILCPLLRESRHEQSVGFDHHLRVARFHREHEVVVAEVAGDAGELERALDHAERGIAVTVHDAVAERAVVRADAHGAAVLLHEKDERREALADALQFGGVLRVGVFDDLEFLRVGVVAGVDADFLDPLRGLQRGLGFEMDVGHDRHAAAARAQPGDDVLEVRRVLHRRRGDADDFTPDRREIERLLDARRGVHGVAGDHRLHADGIAPADADGADAHLAGGAALVVER